MSQPSAERLGNGMRRVRCRVCGTVFVAASARAVYCSETCAELAPRNADPERARLAGPIYADSRRRRELRSALKAALADPQGYASGRLRIPTLGLSTGQLRDVRRRGMRRAMAALGLKKAAIRKAMRIRGR